MPKSTTALTWNEWVQEFKHGRTHDTYGLMLLFAIIMVRIAFEVNGIAIPVKYSLIMDIIALIITVGVLVDLVAHLWKH